MPPRFLDLGILDEGARPAPTSLPSRIEMLCMLERRLRGSQDGRSGEKPRLSLRQESIADSPVL